MSEMIDAKDPSPDYTQTYPILEWREGGLVVAEEVPIIREYRIQVEVDGVECMSIMCTPGEDPAMVAGRLFTEGFIDGIAELEAMEFEPLSECLTRARVRLARRLDSLVSMPVEEVPSVGAGSQVVFRFDGRQKLESYLSRGEYKPWRVDDVFRLDALFAKDSPLHKLTSGAHSCYLMRAGELVSCVEDIGRHNTVDKAIGWALLNGVDMSELMVFISGRVPTDMMTKAVRAKFGAFVSRKSPTREAIDMARAYRVTLIGDVEKGRLKVFSGLQPVGHDGGRG